MGGRGNRGQDRDPEQHPATALRLGRDDPAGAGQGGRGHAADDYRHRDGTAESVEAGKHAPLLTLAFRIARLFDAEVEDVFEYEDAAAESETGPDDQRNTNGES